MKLVLIICLIASLSYISLTASASVENQLIPSSLNDFKDIYSTFITNMVPIYNGSSKDFSNKVKEFHLMTGIQQFLSISSLYASYLPVYSICKQQILLQLTEFPKLTKSLNGPNVLLSYSDMVTFDKAEELFSVGDSAVISGVVETINAVQQAIRNIAVNGDTLEMSGNLAVSIGKGLSEIMSGNEDLVQGLIMSTSVDQKTIISEQDDEQSANFMKSLFSFFASLQEVYTDIRSAEMNVYEIFENASESTPFSTSISTFNNVVNTAYMKISKLLYKAGQTSIIFRKEMNKSND